MATSTLQYIPEEMKARKELDVRAGDTVKVHIKIEEKGKTRIQIFEGLVLAQKHGHEAGATITVRKIASGVGVEKIFPIYSPNIDKIEVIRRSKVRRAKLYYIRTKVAREIRRKMRNFVNYFSTTDDLVPVEEMMEETEEETPVVAETVETEATPEVKEDAPVEAPAETEDAPAAEVKEDAPVEEESAPVEETPEVPTEESTKEEEK